jgi:hypothetical protein
LSWGHQCIHPDDLARASAEFAAAIERGDEQTSAE